MSPWKIWNKEYCHSNCFLQGFCNGTRTNIRMENSEDLLTAKWYEIQCWHYRLVRLGGNWYGIESWILLLLKSLPHKSENWLTIKKVKRIWTISTTEQNVSLQCLEWHKDVEQVSHCSTQCQPRYLAVQIIKMHLIVRKNEDGIPLGHM